MGGSHAPHISREAEQLWRFLFSINATVIPAHVKGECNQTADFLSRHKLSQYEFGLKPAVLQKVLFNSFVPEFDLFVSKHLHVADKFAALIWHREATAGDAFLMQEWPDLSFIFPPFPLLHKVVSRLNEHPVQFVLIAPSSAASAGQPWWPLLQPLLTHRVRDLGPIKKVCRTPQGGPPSLPGNLSMFVRMFRQ